MSDPHDHDHSHDGDHDHDHDHDHDEDEDDDAVLLEDADGKVTEFVFLGTVEVDAIEYALLTPMEGDGSEIFVFTYDADEDGGERYGEVPDDETLAKVQLEAEKMFSGQESEEE